MVASAVEGAFAEGRGGAAPASSLAGSGSLAGTGPMASLHVKVGSGEAEVKDLETALTMLQLYRSTGVSWMEQERQQPVSRDYRRRQL